MKNLLKITPFLFIAFLLLFSCKKEETQVVFDGGKAPVLVSSRATNTVLPLDFQNADNPILNLTWNNPAYTFNTGISSQDVSYVVEIDTVGANFTNPKKVEITFLNALNCSIKDGDFNDKLLNKLKLVKSIPHQVELRLKSSLVSGAGVLYSNTFKFTVTPYAIPPKVTPPGTAPNYLDGTLYITGAATPGNWMSGGAPALNTQKFVQDPLDFTKYTLASIALNGGAEYLLVPVYGDWSNKFGFTGAGAANNPESDEFKPNGNNFKAPAASANYKIVVDFQSGTYTITKL
jgi:starch-binding outer membrane protein SusE/F